MTELSERAKRFLAGVERLSSTVDREQIIESFLNNDAPVFEPLIEFQQKYSGYKFLAGLEIIHCGILQGDGGYPVRSGTAIVEFSVSYPGTSNYEFVCATADCQPIFTLDEYGRFYENGEIIASSFDKKMEHLAIWDELEVKEDFRIVLHEQALGIQELDMKLDLTMIREASDQYTLWFKNDSIYLKQCSGRSTIVTSENFDKIKALIN